MSLVRCMEVIWHGPGKFSHTGSPVCDWQSVLDRAAAIRLVENVQHGRGAAIYEVDLVDPDSDPTGPSSRRTVQFLVTGDALRTRKLIPDA